MILPLQPHSLFSLTLVDVRHDLCIEERATWPVSAGSMHHLFRAMTPTLMMSCAGSNSTGESKVPFPDFGFNSRRMICGLGPPFPKYE